jgi:alpha-1,4-digalacturonate transport system permease protein
LRSLRALFTRRRGRRGRLHATDVLAYAYLAVGVIVMFGPVVWLIASSFKTPAGLLEFPPSFLPYTQEMVEVEGFDRDLPLYEATLEDGTVERLALVRRIGLQAQLVDPDDPAETITLPTERIERTRVLRFATENYTVPLQRFNFLTYLRNSVVVTVVATLITLVVNSMAAFALSKYRFRGRNVVFLLIIGTLMIPISVILVPIYLVITQVGWVNSLWGVIIPGAATPTGVFLLRQYMLTIPDQLLDAGRIDGASEWRLYWQIVLPLSAPAMAVLAIFSVMWRWNDFLWPLIVLTRSELFTLQVGLNAFQGELNVQWHYVLAMTVLTLLPITLVFAFLQRFITTGIASSGVKQ